MLHHARTRFHRNVVPLCDRKISVDVEMHVHEDQVAGLACAQVVYVEHTPCRNQRCADRLHIFIVGHPGHQIMQCVPAERGAHFHDHPADDQRGDGGSSG